MLPTLQVKLADLTSSGQARELLSSLKTEAVLMSRLRHPHGELDKAAGTVAGPSWDAAELSGWALNRIKPTPPALRLDVPVLHSHTPCLVSSLSLPPCRSVPVLWRLHGAALPSDGGEGFACTLFLNPTVPDTPPSIPRRGSCRLLCFCYRTLPPTVLRQEQLRCLAQGGSAGPARRDGRRPELGATADHGPGGRQGWVPRLLLRHKGCS